MYSFLSYIDLNKQCNLHLDGKCAGQMDVICINAIQIIVFHVHNIFNFHTWLWSHAGSKPTSRGSAKSDNDAPRPLVVPLPSSLHESIHLFPCPKAEEWRPPIAGSCQPEVFCWNGPNHPGRVTHWHPPSGQDRAHTCPFQASAVCVKQTDRLCRVHVRLFNSEPKKCIFYVLFWSIHRVFSVLVDEQYTGGKYSPLVCWINAMSDPWCFI